MLMINKHILAKKGLLDHTLEPEHQDPLELCCSEYGKNNDPHT